ncbi:hypothetical protein B0H17DRAFT_1192297 [Mycena rosella]|uniref:Uncharacterized protein n=1 Tax=Mycena rosella TaxID=1033263 RepID=A0AAD7GWH3_MYCRO|nr:hypothetical protein B0H17DRAFT_1192297 [Mycena rosella]
MPTVCVPQLTLLHRGPRVQYAFEGDTVRVPIDKARTVACKMAYRKSGGAPAQTPPAARSWSRPESLAIMAATSPPAPPASVHHHRALPGTLADLSTLERLICAPHATAEIFIGRPSSGQFFVLEKRDTPDAAPRVVAAVNVLNNALDNAIAAAAARHLNGSAPAAAVHPCPGTAWRTPPPSRAPSCPPSARRSTRSSPGPNSRPCAGVRPGPRRTTRWLSRGSPSPLARFLAAPALTARLARAAPILGTHYVGTLHIWAVAMHTADVALHVAGGAVSVGPSTEKPSVTLPRGAGAAYDGTWSRT